MPEDKPSWAVPASNDYRGAQGIQVGENNVQNNVFYTSDQDICDAHALKSIGRCPRHRNVSICPRCNGLCPACHQAQQAAQAELAKAELIRQQAAQAAVAQRLAAQRAAEAKAAADKRGWHEAKVKANAARYPKPQPFYVGELREVNAQLSKIDRELERKVGPRTSTPVLLIFFRTAWIITLAAWLTSGMTPPGDRTSIIAVFLILGFFWFGGARLLLGSLVKSKKSSLDTRRAALLEAVGCGSRCEFGCHIGL
jgi:hypothetical protein